MNFLNRMVRFFLILSVFAATLPAQESPTFSSSFRSDAKHIRYMINYQHRDKTIDQYAFMQAFIGGANDSKVPKAVSSLVLDFALHIRIQDPQVNAQKFEQLIFEANQTFMEIYDDSLKTDKAFFPNDILSAISKAGELIGDGISVFAGENKNMKKIGGLMELTAKTLGTGNNAYAWFQEEKYGDQERAKVSASATGKLADFYSNSSDYDRAQKLWEIINADNGAGKRGVDRNNPDADKVMMDYSRVHRGVSPKDSAFEIFTNNPEQEHRVSMKLAADMLNTNIVSIDKKIAGLGQSHNQIKIQLKEVKKAVLTKLKHIDKKIENLDHKTDVVLAGQEQHFNLSIDAFKTAIDTNVKVTALLDIKKAEIEAAQKQQKVQNELVEQQLITQSILGFSDVLGKLNPKHAKIYAVFGHVIKLSSAVGKMHTLISNVSIGKNALKMATGDVLGAALGLIGLFGPEQSDVKFEMLQDILEQLGVISEQIANLGDYVQARFDHLDSTLLSYHLESLTRTAQILSEIEANREHLLDIKDKLNLHTLELEGLSFKIYDTHSGLSQVLKDGFNQDAVNLLSILDRVYEDPDAANHTDQLLELDGKIRAHIFKHSRNAVQLGPVAKSTADVSDISIYNAKQTEGEVSVDMAIKHARGSADFKRTFPEPSYYQTWVQAFSRLYLKYPLFAKKAVSKKFSQRVADDFASYLRTKCQLTKPDGLIVKAASEYESAAKALDAILLANVHDKVSQISPKTPKVDVRNQTGNWEMLVVGTTYRFPMPKVADQLVPNWVKKIMYRDKRIKLRWELKVYEAEKTETLKEIESNSYYETPRPKQKSSWKAAAYPTPTKYKAVYEIKEVKAKPHYVIQAYMTGEKEPIASYEVHGKSPVSLGTIPRLKTLYQNKGSKPEALSPKITLRLGTMATRKMSKEAEKKLSPHHQSLRNLLQKEIKKIEMKDYVYKSYLAGSKPESKEQKNNFYLEKPIKDFAQNKNPQLTDKYQKTLAAYENKEVNVIIAKVKNTLQTVASGGSVESIADPVGSAALRLQVKFLVFEQLLRFGLPENAKTTDLLDSLANLPNHANLHILTKGLDAPKSYFRADGGERLGASAREYRELVSKQLELVDQVPCATRDYPMETSTSGLVKRMMDL